MLTRGPAQEAGVPAARPLLTAQQSRLPGQTFMDIWFFIKLEYLGSYLLTSLVLQLFGESLPSLKLPRLLFFASKNTSWPLWSDK